MEHLEDGLTCLISAAFGSCRRHCPYSHMRSSDAIASAGAKMLRPICSQLSHTADLKNLQADVISPSQLKAKICKTTLLLSMLYQALTLSCHKVTAETTVFILWKSSALLISGCRAEAF